MFINCLLGAFGYFNLSGLEFESNGEGGNYLIAIHTNMPDTNVFIVDADVCGQDIHKDLIVGWNSIDSFLDNIKTKSL